jgi:cyclic pyranopterin phosphate synthase
MASLDVARNAEKDAGLMAKLTHINAKGEASMVDVSAKPIVLREAIASAEIVLRPATIRAIQKDKISKGNVLAVARIAGISAAKKTGELIPLCHPLPLTHCEVNFAVRRNCIIITASAKIAAQTGIEMEALTAVSVAALTIYDMCKAIDKTMRVENIHLVAKTKKPI